jgi:hypothetical protein
MLNLIDEYKRKCLTIRVARRFYGGDAIDTPADAMKEHGILEHVRSDNRPEFTGKDLRQ